MPKSPGQASPMGGPTAGNNKFGQFFGQTLAKGFNPGGAFNPAGGIGQVQSKINPAIQSIIGALTGNPSAPPPGDQMGSSTSSISGGMPAGIAPDAGKGFGAQTGWNPNGGMTLPPISNTPSTTTPYTPFSMLRQKPPSDRM